MSSCLNTQLLMPAKPIHFGVLAVKNCPRCNSTDICWDGVSYIWLCLAPGCLWFGDDQELASVDSSNAFLAYHRPECPGSVLPQ